MQLNTILLQLSGKKITVSEATLRMDMARVRYLKTEWKDEEQDELKNYRFVYAYLSAVTTPCPSFDEYLDMTIGDSEKWIDAVSKLNPTFFPNTNPTPAPET